MELKENCTIPPEIFRACQGLTQSESVKLLRETANKTVDRGLFADHFERLQSTATPNKPKYAEWKKKKYGSDQVLYLTGNLYKSLLDSNSEYLHIRSNKKRRVTISLYRKVEGHNVYRYAQSGKFMGLIVKGKRSYMLNTEQSLAFAQRRRARRALGMKNKQYDYSRVSAGSGRTVMLPQPGDVEFVSPILQEELNITMKYRGMHNG